jgi:ATP/maltotriose-dependent transcriptional regulator MalT
MDLEIDNVRSVMRSCVTHDDFAGGVILATSASWYWITRATAEGVRWLDELLASVHRNPEVNAWAYFIRGFLAVLQGDPAAARPALARAVAASRESGQLIALSNSLSMASIAENLAGDTGSARRLLDGAAAVTTGLDDLAARVGLLQARSLNGFFEGDLETVRSASSEGVRLSRVSGDLYSLEMMLMNLGLTALIIGDLDGSRPLLEEALRIARHIDDRVAQYALLDALGYHAARSGQARLAAQLLGAAETVRTGAGANLIAYLAPLLTQAEELAIATLGASRFEAEINAGKQLSRGAAIGLALGEKAQVAAAAPGENGAGPLGKREAEVARLVADGMSNKQIGARLFISERTVDSHVRGILNKRPCK